MQVIWVKMESKYFCERGWTGKSTNDPPGKSGMDFQPIAA
jgi:hypothetical protein